MDDNLRGVLAPQILGARVILKAVAVIGEIITLDARLCDRGGGLMQTNSLEEICRGLENYEQLVEGARAAVQKFQEERDQLAFLQFLSDLRNDLSVLPEKLKAADGPESPTKPTVT